MRSLHKSVGFSDHSKTEASGINLSVASLLFNVDYIERHFTIINRDATKDGVVSLKPNELAQLVKLAKNKDKNEIQKFIDDNFKDYENALE